MARAVGQGHGRLAVRARRLTGTPTKSQDWAGLKQGFELRRERAVKGVQSVGLACGITSPGRARAAAARLLGLVRGRWGLESGSQHGRDVTLGEGASRLRQGDAPPVRAALGHTVSPLAGAGGSGSAEAARPLNNGFSQAPSLLGLPQLE